jgi:ABC-type Mn2+/Zn2+ transport system permease subunit
MEIFISPFVSNGFMLNALVAGCLVSVACGIVGSFVVLRGLAFIGDALAHGVLPGVAVAMIFGFPGMLGAAVGSLAMILGIGYITRRSNLSTDTAIGLLFVGMLALGVAIVSRSHSFSGDLVRVLFGEILGITASEILLQLTATILLAAASIVCYRPFLLLCFSEEQAEASGFSARFYHSVMLFMIAITVVVSFRTVGTLLVFGMLLAPAATAALFSRRITSMMIYSSGIGMISVYTGLLLSYQFNIAAGASITITAVLVFFISLAAKGLSRISLREPSAKRAGIREDA